MANRNGEKGKRWERDLRNGFRGASLPTEQTRDTGTFDEGDLAVHSGNREQIFVVEAKDATLNVAGFLNEAAVEAEHYFRARPYLTEEVIPVVAWKRRGKGFKDGVIMLTIADFIRLVGGKNV